MAARPSRILDTIVANAAATQTATRQQPRGQTFDADGKRLASGQYTEKRYNAAGQELPQTRGWINVGRVEKIVNAAGEKINQFINLQLGIPVDSILKFTASPNNQLRRKQNKLRSDVVDMLDDMEPGEERILHLEVRIRKVFDQAELEMEDDNDEDDDAAPLWSPVAVASAMAPAGEEE